MGNGRRYEAFMRTSVMTQHEPDGQREPDQARSDIRNGGPFDAKRRKRAGNLR